MLLCVCMQPCEVTLKGDQVAGLSLAQESLTGQLQMIAVNGCFGACIVASSSTKRIMISRCPAFAARDPFLRSCLKRRAWQI